MNEKGHISRGDRIVDQVPHPQAPSEEILAAMGEVRRGERDLLAVVYGFDTEYVDSSNVEAHEAGLKRLMGLPESGGEV